MADDPLDDAIRAFAGAPRQSDGWRGPRLVRPSDVGDVGSGVAGCASGGGGGAAGGAERGVAARVEPLYEQRVLIPGIKHGACATCNPYVIKSFHEEGSRKRRRFLPRTMTYDP